jgi:predicted MFS family arabinose efflux permease
MGVARWWLGPCAALAVAGWGGNQFTPLVILYRQQVGHPDVVITAVFGAYVLGLVPGFLLGGGMSDRRGRRIVWWALLISAAASAVLAVGATSEPLLFVGRILAGLSLGVTMSAGTSWVKELSRPLEAAGARRASTALTLGFMAGPLCAGVLAQWGPWPLVTPYVVHVVLSVATALVVRAVPETVVAPRRADGSRGRVFAGDVRPLWLLVLPAAPWVFGGVAVSIVILPTAVATRLGDYPTAYATLLIAVTLSAGLVAQSYAKRRVERSGVARTLAIAMAFLLAGLAVAVAAAATLSALLPVAAAVLLGTSYGFSLPSGLLQIQRLAAPGALARATAVYYSLTYAGFGLPLVFSLLRGRFAPAPILAVTGVVALTCALVVWRTAAIPQPAGRATPP